MANAKIKSFCLFRTCSMVNPAMADEYYHKNFCSYMILLTFCFGFRLKEKGLQLQATTFYLIFTIYVLAPVYMSCNNLHKLIIYNHLPFLQ